MQRRGFGNLGNRADGVLLEAGAAGNTIGGTQSSASAINDNGQVVGGAQLAGNSGGNGFLYSGRVMTKLLPLTTDGVTASGAVALNNPPNPAQVAVVGSSYAGPGTQAHAVLWQNVQIGIPATPSDLGNLGGTQINPRAINNALQVVGDGTTAAGEDRGSSPDPRRARRNARCSSSSSCFRCRRAGCRRRSRTAPGRPRRSTAPRLG